VPGRTTFPALRDPYVSANRRCRFPDAGSLTVQLKFLGSVAPACLGALRSARQQQAGGSRPSRKVDPQLPDLLAAGDRCQGAPSGYRVARRRKREPDGSCGISRLNPLCRKHAGEYVSRTARVFRDRGGCRKLSTWSLPDRIRQPSDPAVTTTNGAASSLMACSRSSVPVPASGLDGIENQDIDIVTHRLAPVPV
jgi:hypothetical protein